MLIKTQNRTNMKRSYARMVQKHKLTQTNVQASTNYHVVRIDDKRTAQHVEVPCSDRIVWKRQSIRHATDSANNARNECSAVAYATCTNNMYRTTKIMDDGHCPPENRQSTGDAIPWKRVNIDDIKSEWKIPIQKNN